MPHGSPSSILNPQLTAHPKGFWFFLDALWVLKEDEIKWFFSKCNLERNDVTVSRWNWCHWPAPTAHRPPHTHTCDLPPALLQAFRSIYKAGSTRTNPQLWLPSGSLWQHPQVQCVNINSKVSEVSGRWDHQAPHVNQKVRAPKHRLHSPASVTVLVQWEQQRCWEEQLLQGVMKNFTT